MIIAINIIDGHGLSNEACCEFLPKNAVLAIHFIIKVSVSTAETNLVMCNTPETLYLYLYLNDV